MKMLKKRGRADAWKNVKVTDIDGDVTEFDTIRAAAEFMNVSRQALYIALKSGFKVRGCTIEAEKV